MLPYLLTGYRNLIQAETTAYLLLLLALLHLLRVERARLQLQAGTSLVCKEFLFQREIVLFTSSAHPLMRIASQDVL